MGLFGKKKKQPRPRRAMPLEEKQRRRADKYYIAKVEKDPKLMDPYIEKFLGLEIPSVDPVKEGKIKLQVTIIEKTIEEINKNPGLAKRLSLATIEELAGIKVDHRGEEGYDGEGHSLSAMGQFLQKIDEYEELSDRLGRGRSGGFLGMDGNTIGLILRSFLNALGLTKGIGGMGQLTGQPGDQPVSPLRRYVAEIDGQMKELSEDQYQLLLQQGKVKPLVRGSHKEEEPEAQAPLTAVTGEITPPVGQPEIDDAAPQPEEVKVTREPTPEEQGKFQTIMAAISPSFLVDAMDKTPEDFVAELYTDIENGEEMSKNIIGFLSQVDTESFFELLRLFKNHPKYGTFITSIITGEGREWLLSVVSLVRKANSAPE